ncbi:hypothetical protein AB1N83_010991 [Pleurotus pulmonarius]
MQLALGNYPAQDTRVLDTPLLARIPCTKELRLCFPLPNSRRQQVRAAPHMKSNIVFSGFIHKGFHHMGTPFDTEDKGTAKIVYKDGGQSTRS